MTRGVGMPQTQKISESVTISSNSKNIRGVSSRIVDLLMERRIDKSLIFDIRLAFEEAVINAIEHGNKAREDLNVNIAFQIYWIKLKPY